MSGKRHYEIGADAEDGWSLEILVSTILDGEDDLIAQDLGCEGLFYKQIEI
jgi:hypothetical protein